VTLKHPDTSVDFHVSPAYFVGDFDIYDREDCLGEYLNQYDPNNKNELHKLLREKFFGGARVGKLTPEHKAELMRVLIDALKTKDYDFDSILSHEREPDDYFTLPWDWEFVRPRYFFEEVYRLACELWESELSSIGNKLPNLSELDITNN
tara:strand:+ start:1655 stop:2104 length:450 start_codon:yes stop_codon:yes gene_type:complete